MIHLFYKATMPGWLLLIHQIPPKPSYFRVKIWRRLQRLGAVGIKNSVYALPSSDQALEDFNWVLREIVEGGGDASLVEARLVEGLSDDQLKEMFRAARDADYQEIADEARELARVLPRKGQLGDERRVELEAQLTRLQKKAAEIAAVDFFDSRGRGAARPPACEGRQGGGAGGETARADLGDAHGNPRRSHGQRLAHPAFHRSRRQGPVLRDPRGPAPTPRAVLR